ncbi:MAG: hypothetical protein QXI02_07510 [Candidatus Caldarchaeum sp.]
MTFVDMAEVTITSDGLPIEVRIALLSIATGLLVDRLLTELLFRGAGR